VRAEARLTRSFARRLLHSQYRQSALALLWSILQPIALVIVYAVVFSQILQVEGGGLPYLSFVVAGLAVWRYFNAGLQQATSFIDRSDTLSKVYFRREVIPLSGCMAALVDLVIGFVALLVVAWIQGIRPTYAYLALPLVIAVLLLYTLAVAVMVATVTVFIRDLAHALPTISQVLFLASPILYPESQIPENLKFLGTVNPVAVVAEATRDVTLVGVWPDWSLLLVHLSIGAALFVASIVYIRAIEDRIVDVV
jgi:ABC-type polysaccharide/polyol phosphate export permease